MLLASCASLLVTAGLALYDYLENHRKKHHHHSDYKDKKGSQSIKILLTGGPYTIDHLDVEEKVKASTASTTLSKASPPQSSSSQKQPLLSVPLDSPSTSPSSSLAKSNSSRFTSCDYSLTWKKL